MSALPFISINCSFNTHSECSGVAADHKCACSCHSAVVGDDSAAKNVVERLRLYTIAIELIAAKQGISPYGVMFDEMYDLMEQIVGPLCKDCRYPKEAHYPDLPWLPYPRTGPMQHGMDHDFRTRH